MQNIIHSKGFYSLIYQINKLKKINKLNKNKCYKYLYNLKVIVIKIGFI